MGTILTPDDVKNQAPNVDAAIVDERIADLESIVGVEAPCLLALDPEKPADKIKLDRARAILRGAFLRWARSGENVVSSTSQSVGPVSYSTSFDTSHNSDGRLYARELDELRALCKPAGGNGRRRRAFTVMPR